MDEQDNAALEAWRTWAKGFGFHDPDSDGGVSLSVFEMRDAFFAGMNARHNGKVVIVLDLEDAETLDDAVNNYRDEGPEGSGWASDELSRVRSIVSDAVRQYKKKSTA